MTKILLTILLFAIPAFAQLPNLAKFELIATIHNGEVMGMTQFLDKNADTVLFNGLVANIISAKDGATQLDPQNFSVTQIRADCKTHSFAYLESYGKWDGQYFNNKLEPNTNSATAGSLIFLAIDRNCNRKLTDLKGKDGL